MNIGLNLSPQHRIFAAFFVYSLALGGIFPRLDDIQSALGINKAVLGQTLIGTAVGTQIALMFFGPLIEKLGYRKILLTAIPALALVMALVSFAPEPGIVFATLLIAGLAIGSIEIVVNVEADRTEALLSKRLMNRAHAFWSFGFFAAGMVGAGMKQFGVSPQLHLMLMVVVITIGTVLALGRYEPAPVRNSDEGAKPKFIRPSFAILTMVAFTLSAMLLEGAGAEWSVIYMRSIFDAPPFINAFAFAIGAFAQAVVRFYADGIIDRLGPLKVARTLILLLGLGATLVSFAPSPFIAILGFALMGVGTSAVFPLAMSAAAQRTDRPAAVNVAALAQLSFITFLVAPPFLGFVAEHFGDRYVYGVGLPLVVLSWFTVHSIAPGNRDDN